MAYHLTIARPAGGPLDLDIDVGQMMFVLGANGTGKSGLMHRFYSAHPANTRRLSAHRQTWMTSNAISLSPEQKRNTENSMVGNDAQPTARWRDDFSAARPGIAIYDLIDSENVRARGIAEAFDRDDVELAKELRKQQPPIKVINELLRLSHIPVEISVHRVAWELENGQIPADRHVLHTCDNPPCCRPDHLWLGTHDDRPRRALRRRDLNPCFGRGHVFASIAFRLRRTESPIR